MTFKNSGYKYQNIYEIILLALSHSTVSQHGALSIVKSQSQGNIQTFHKLFHKQTCILKIFFQVNRKCISGITALRAIPIESTFDNKCNIPVKKRSLSFPFRGFLAVAASSSTVAT